MNTKWIVVAVIVGGTVLMLASPLIVFFIHYEINARPPTPWCDHPCSDLTTCGILDESEGRILLQHADLDYNIYYLEIISGDERREYAMPPLINRLAPHGYVARLLPDEPDKVEIILGNDDDGIDKAAVDWRKAIPHQLQLRAQ